MRTSTDIAALHQQRFESYLELVLKKAGSRIQINRSSNGDMPDDRLDIFNKICETLIVMGIKHEGTSSKYTTSIKVEK